MAYKNLQKLTHQYLEEGRRACKQGKKLSDNPYIGLSSFKNSAWVSGWEIENTLKKA